MTDLPDGQDPRRALPGVDALLASTPFRALLERHPRGRLVAAARIVLDGERERAGRGEDPCAEPAELARRVEGRLLREAEPSLRPVLNATGVILHTNLGRAPLSRAALRAMVRVGRGYSNLEFDLGGGVRGSRYGHCVALLTELCGAEDALVVNNAAAALLLAVNTAAAGREVIVSRGELVEIGGGFRIPEILTRGGTRLREVGTTNRTRIDDYRRAVEEGGAAALLKVHRSNFRMTGYVADVGVRELAALGRSSELPVIHDVGSGLLASATGLGLAGEPSPKRSMEEGADVALFSGDKLLGGPQAGIVVGRGEWLDRLRRNPLCRALRVDKTTLAALEGTLRAYREGGEDGIVPAVPVLRMLSASYDELFARVASLREFLESSGPTGMVEIREGASVVGGGTVPGVEIPSPLLMVCPEEGTTAEELSRRLRSGEPPVVARVAEGCLAVDLRTVPPRDEATLRGALLSALGRPS